MAALPEEGKFRIGSVGPIKESTAKKTGNPYRIASLQFEQDAQWYDTFWISKEDPKIGQELEGKKSYDEEYKTFKFEVNRAGGKGNWNPAGANAAVMGSAVALVHNWLTMDPKNKADWEAKRRQGEAPLDHYLRTVFGVARLIKEDVVKMGGAAAEVQSNNTARPSSADQPPASSYNQPPEIEPYGETSVDLP